MNERVRGDVLQAAAAETRAAEIVATLESLERERLAFSKADLRGRAAVAARMSAMGLDAQIDSAFNVLGWLPGSEDLPPLVVGSHLDTVSNGGRFDGALGVLAALECARRVKLSDAPLRHPLLVAGFSDEEGTATMGCWGSRVRLGLLTPDEMDALADEGSSLREALLEAAEVLAAEGWSVDPVAVLEMERLSPAAYLELHVEQGPILERRGVPTAAVTSIVGIHRHRVVIHGTSGHAGTVPMRDKDDVVIRAAGLLREFWDEVVALGSQAVLNFGRVDVRPGDFNVIPDEVRIAVEFRSPEPDVLRRLDERLETLASGAGGEVEVVGRDAPVELDARVRRATLSAAAETGIDCLELPSWAGHDAAVFAPLAPTGMVFVPSIGGLSHCQGEFTRTADIAAGVEVLLATIRRLDAELA